VHLIGFIIRMGVHAAPCFLTSILLKMTVLHVY